MRRADFDDRPHQPGEQIDAVNRLVHQRAAAVERPGAAPRPAVVVLLRAKPFHVGIADREPAEAAGVDRALQLARRLVKARWKDRRQLDAVFFAFADDPVALRSVIFERLFDDDVLAGAGGGDGRFQMGAAGRGDRDASIPRIGQHCRESRIGGAASFGGKFLGGRGSRAEAGNELCPADVGDRPRVKSADRAAADDAESDGHRVPFQRSHQRGLIVIV